MRVSQPRISQIETSPSLSPLPRRTLVDLADSLGVTVEALVADDPSYRFMELDESELPPASGLLAPPQVALVGREADAAAAGRQLRAGARLLTLVGPGGVGKTQLALAVARHVSGEFPRGAVFVPLAECLDAASVVAVIARAVGVGERGADSLRTRLLAGLPAGRMLLVLDNVEQAVSAIATLASDLLAAYPELTLLATGRVALNIPEECIHIVRPLALPRMAEARSVAMVIAAPAVELFVQRARESHPTFAIGEANAADVAAICAHLDGLPLAIELAAARVRVYSPAQLLRHLDRRLEFHGSPSRFPPKRQRSLRASIEWSVGLLQNDRQSLFLRLAAFSGGFTLEAAARVAAPLVPRSPYLRDTLDRTLHETADGLAALLEHHLLTRADQVDGTPRFGMLETIHEFAAERLQASNEAETVRRRHLEWAIGLAERGDAALFGFEQESWLLHLDAEWQNLRHALEWAITRREAELALRLTAALTDYWYLRGMLSEGSRWLDQALDIGGDEPLRGPLPQTRIRALAGASQLAQPRGDLATAMTHAGRALTLAQAAGDRQGEARALALMANLALVADDFPRAATLHQAALALFIETGEHHRWTIAGLNNLSLIAYGQGDYGTALALADEALQMAVGHGDCWGENIAHQRLADAALALNQTGRAANHVIACLKAGRTDALMWGTANAIAACGSLAASVGRAGQSARLLAAASSLYRELGVRIPPKLRPDWGSLVERAQEQCGAARYAAAWEAGSHLSVGDAAAEALAVAQRIAAASSASAARTSERRRPHRVRANVLVRKSGTKPMRR